jgi:Zn-dependent protease with chaperone function
MLPLPTMSFASRIRPLLPVCTAAVLAATGIHCGEPDAAEDEADHTAKAPIYDNAPYFWAVTDYPTFKAGAQAAPFKTGAPLEANSALTTRLQTWADRIHAEVAKDVKKRSGAALVAPKPVIVVIPAKSANAWVSGLPACFSAEADLSAVGKAGRPARTAALAFASHDGIKEAVGMFGAPPPKCASPTNWKSLEEAIAFFNAGGSKCKLARGAGDRVKVTGAECELFDNAPTAAKQLTFYATSQYVHVTSAMIALAKDEQGLVGVLAHELGHFYRAHVVSELVLGKYNYWYEQKDPPQPIQPPPAADAAQLAAALHHALPFPMPVVAGQKLSYRLTDVVLDSVAQLLTDANAAAPGFACADAVTKLGSWQYDFGGIGASYVKGTTQEAYLAFERSLLACAGRVPVTAAGGSGALKLSDLREGITRNAEPFASPAVAEGTLATVLETLGARAAVADQELNTFLDGVRTRRLGLYTAEQEADEFSLEYFSRIGLAPRARIDSYFDLIKAHAADDQDRFVAANGGLTVAACETLFRADFKVSASSQARAFVPLGNLLEPHHGDCYRLFNMSQELRAHEYRTAGTAPTFAAPWSTLQAEAQRITDAFVEVGPPGGFHAPERGNGATGGTIVDGP